MKFKELVLLSVSWLQLRGTISISMARHDCNKGSLLHYHGTSHKLVAGVQAQHYSGLAFVVSGLILKWEQAKKREEAKRQMQMSEQTASEGKRAKPDLFLYRTLPQLLCTLHRLNYCHFRVSLLVVDGASQRAHGTSHSSARLVYSYKFKEV